MVKNINFTFLFPMSYIIKMHVETISEISCIENGIKYNIGDNFSTYGNDCKICTCSTGSHDKCQMVFFVKI